jgi:tRNA threonylcarbamoyladenosine biosynthesis protein TsaB
MSVLAIDTATDLMGVAVVDEGRVLASYEVLAERPHSVELPGAVSRVLAAAGVTLAQVEAVAIDIGPGSFTGLRIGLAFLKALMFVTRRPVVAVPSLDALAAGVSCAAGASRAARVCPILDARQRKVYAAIYDVTPDGPTRRGEWMLGPIDDVITAIGAAGGPSGGRGPSVTLLGDGAQVYRDRLRESLGASATFAAPEFWLPRAATVGRLGLARARAGQVDDISRLTPLYLYRHDNLVRPSSRQPGAPRKVTRA